jgi:hypothetical protein
MPVLACGQLRKLPRRIFRIPMTGLMRAATKAQWPVMVIHLVYAVLAIVLAAMAVLAFAAISKIEEPRRHHP